MKEQRVDGGIVGELTAELREVLATGYVMGSLSEAERRQVEARLAAGDRALEALIAAIQDGLACFASEVKAVAPAPGTKARLFANLEAEVQASEQAKKATAASEEASEVLPTFGRMDPDSDYQKLSSMLGVMLKNSPQARTPTRPARKAVLVIDMLHDYIDEGAPMEVPLARSIVSPLQQLLSRERSEGTPIIYVNDRHPSDDSDFDVWPRHAVRGTPGAEVIAALRPARNDLYVDRVSYSAFFETDLEPMLQKMGVTDLVLTGQAADACILGTAIDALMRGYDVEVPEDCVAALTEEGKVFALRRIKLLKPYQGKRRR